MSWRTALHVRREQHRVQEYPRVRRPAVPVTVAIAAAAAAANGTDVTSASDPLRCLGPTDTVSLVHRGTGAVGRTRFSRGGVAGES